MTVSLCIRQVSKRNDDWVSVEELDWSAESQVLIPAEHLCCDFKCRSWAKNSSPNTNDLYIHFKDKSTGTPPSLEEKKALPNCGNKEVNVLKNVIYNTTVLKCMKWLYLYNVPICHWCLVYIHTHTERESRWMLILLHEKQGNVEIKKIWLCTWFLFCHIWAHSPPQVGFFAHFTRFWFKTAALWKQATSVIKTLLSSRHYYLVQVWIRFQYLSFTLVRLALRAIVQVPAGCTDWRWGRSWGLYSLSLVSLVRVGFWELCWRKIFNVDNMQVTSPYINNKNKKMYKYKCITVFITSL